MYPISAVYSFPLPVSSGNIPGIPDVSPFRWGLPAPSESPENKIWPVTACFPVSGTYPCLSLLMKNLPEQSRRILPAYWHLENAQCSRFLTGCLPLRQYQFPASSSGYIESKAGCLLSPLPPPASVPGCKVVVTGSPSNPLLGGQIGLPCSSNHPPHHHRKSNFSDKEVQQSARWTASPALYLQFPIHQLMKFFLYIISSFYTYHWNRHIFLQKLINYFFYKESHSIDFCIIV